jgi:PAS domain S-box-containing protein
MAMLVGALVAGSIAVFSFHAVQQESNRATAAMTSQALAHAENIARPSVDFIFARDFASLETLLLRAARFPAVTHIQVCDVAGRLYGDVVEDAHAKPVARFGQPDLSPPLTNKADISVTGQELVVWYPIRSGNLALGWVRATHSLADIASTRDRIWMEHVMEGGAAVAVALLLLAIFLRRPLRTVSRYTQFADQLNEARGQQVQVDEGSLELKKLGSALNAASSRLAQQNHDLQNILRDLESQKLALDEHCIVCITDTSGRITYVNGRFCDISQYAAHELLGQSFAAFQADSSSAVSGDKHDGMIHQNIAPHAERRYRKKDGSDFWVDTTIVPFRDETGRPYQYVSIMTDITDRKSAADDLARLAAFAENNPNMVLSMNMHGGIQYRNPAVSETIVALSLTDSDISRLLPADICEVVETSLRDQKTRRGIEVSSHGRSWLWTIAPVKGQQYVHCYAIDITKRKKAEEAAKVALVEKLSAQAATKAKSSFLANMSHEIRTPLTAIVGFAESLLDGGQPLSERLASINSIQRNGRHLLQIINDILDLSKIEADRLAVERVRMSPFELMDDLRSLIELQAQAKGLSVDMQYVFPLPKTIESDPLRLKQVLLNLCSNAIKFTKKGGIRVRVRCDVAAERISFDVVDTGIGLTPSQQARIFSAFTQADSSTTREYGGTGLGLYLSKQLSEMLGGSVSLQSEQGTGSCFTATIATGSLQGVELVHERQAMPSATPVGTAHEMMPLSGTVLLAEDNPDNQRLIAMYIRKTGAEVTIVENGEQAVELALTGQFDIVLMDMQMPVMDGIEATRTLRAKGYCGAIIALTANAMREDRDACIEAGCDGFLTKPINRDLFGEMLVKHLRHDSVSAAPQEPIRSMLIADEPELLDLVVKFATRLPSMVDDLEEALGKPDWTLSKRLVHDLKAVGGSYGYPGVSAVAARLEFEIAKNDLAAAKQYLDDLHNQAGRILLGINSEGPGNTAEAPAHP